MTNNFYTPLFGLSSNLNQQTGQEQPTVASQLSPPNFYDLLEDLVDPQELINGPQYFSSYSTNRLKTSEDVKAYQNSRLAFSDIHCLNNSAKASSTKIHMMQKEKIIQTQNQKNHSQLLIKEEKPKSQPSNGQKVELGTHPNNPFIVHVANPIVPTESSDSSRTPIVSARPQNSNAAQRVREDDSNNAHKKIITCLNKAMRMVQQSSSKLCPNGIKMLPNQHVKALKNQKSSRYGFVVQLCAIQYTHGKRFLQQLFAVFEKHVLPNFISQNNKMEDSPSKEYLLKLPKIYILSYETFLRGEIAQATELIYIIDNEGPFKQKTYMNKGVNKVISFRKSLLKLN